SAVVTVPIRVDATYPLISYKDVAIIEPGNDFVAVEATTDGLNWQTLKKYDASLHNDWQATFDAEESGTRAMLKEHQIDLTETFNDGDLILIRFRLKSNETVDAWGWAVDDLYIQEEPTGIFQPETTASFDVFPNPSSGTINIRAEGFTGESLDAILYNIHGQQVKQYNLIKTDQEIFQLTDNSLLGGYYVLKLQSAGQNIHVQRVVVE
ncbi:MAG: T9SS type A sorting domain-containing protein, partial [Fulvivirga sp.]|nr:T9SS type A sorting domain-containing protein [Fulvivirga sp.]